MDRSIMPDGLGSPHPHPNYDAGSQQSDAQDQDWDHHGLLPAPVSRPHIAKQGILNTPRHSNSSQTMPGVSAFLHSLTWRQAQADDGYKCPTPLCPGLALGLSRTLTLRPVDLCYLPGGLGTPDSRLRETLGSEVGPQWGSQGNWVRRMVKESRG